MQLKNTWVAAGAVALLVAAQAAVAVDSDSNNVDDALTVSVAAAFDQSFPETDLPATPTASVIDFNGSATVTEYPFSSGVGGATSGSGTSVNLPCTTEATNFSSAWPSRNRNTNTPTIRFSGLEQARNITDLTNNCPTSMNIQWGGSVNYTFPVTLSLTTGCNVVAFRNGSTIQAAHVTTGVLRDVGTGSGQLDCATANEWGGAGGEGVYVAPQSGSTDASNAWTLSLNETHRYIGFWWSAGNDPNRVQLLDANGNALLSPLFDSISLYQTLFNSPNRLCRDGTAQWSDYCGNPNPFFWTDAANSATRRTPGEPYAFIHLRYPNGFRGIRFSGNGFELDNITLSVTVPDLGAEEDVVGALPAYSLTAARVIPVDPRSQSVPFPGVLLGGAASNQPNVTLCLSQVTDSSGSSVVTAGDTNLRISAPATAGVTQSLSPPRFTFTGSQTTVRNFASQIRIVSSTSNRSVASSDTVWLRASVQAQLNGGDLTCSQSNNVITAFMIELRPVRLNNVNRLGIPLD